MYVPTLQERRCVTCVRSTSQEDETCLLRFKAASAAAVREAARGAALTFERVAEAVGR